MSEKEFLSGKPWKQTGLRKRSDPPVDVAQPGDSLHLIQRVSWKRESPSAANKQGFGRQHGRRKRTLLKDGAHHQGVTIETAVFVDAFLYNHMARTRFTEHPEREMTHFVLAMMNAVISSPLPAT